MTGSWLFPLSGMLVLAGYALWQSTHGLWRRDRVWISALFGRLVAVAAMVAAAGVCGYGVAGGAWEPTQAPESVTQRTLSTAQSAAATCRAHGGVSSLEGGGWASLTTVVVCRDGVASDLEPLATATREDAAARLQRWTERHARRVELTGQVQLVAQAAFVSTLAMIALMGLLTIVSDRRSSPIGAPA